jgi:hypothetical protein
MIKSKKIYFCLSAVSLVLILSGFAYAEIYYQTSFETQEGFVEGDIEGQDGWGRINTGVAVKSKSAGNPTLYGTQVLELSRNAGNVWPGTKRQITAEFQKIWYDFWIRPCDPGTTGGSQSCLIYLYNEKLEQIARCTFLISLSRYQVQLTNGNDEKGAAILEIVDNAWVPEQWTRITFCLDFSNQVYDFYVNGEKKCEQLAYRCSSASRLKQWDIYGPNPNPSTAALAPTYIDELTVSSSNPFSNVVINAPAKGMAGEKLAISVKLTDINGNPLTNESVTFNSDSENVQFDQAMPIMTGAEGIAKVNLESKVPGEIALRVISKPLAFEYREAKLEIVPNLPASLEINPERPKIAASPKASNNITAIVKDAYGNLVADGFPIHFTAELGSIDECVLTQNGKAVAVLRGESQEHPGVEIMAYCQGELGDKIVETIIIPFEKVPFVPTPLAFGPPTAVEEFKIQINTVEQALGYTLQFSRNSDFGKELALEEQIAISDLIDAISVETPNGIWSLDQEQKIITFVLHSKLGQSGQWFWRIGAWDAYTISYADAQKAVLFWNGEYGVDGSPCLEVMPKALYPKRNQEVRIFLVLSEPYLVSISIYNLKGQLVRTVAKEVLADSGLFDQLTWDGQDNKGRFVPSGLYIIQATIDSPGKKYSITNKVAVFGN